ncbi:MAG: CPBP family intramembrane metalloprotease [Rhodocyclaceae bacterium]|nr:CPBP family intramembrane metalloprotease [Rhodocyclaceae bacterium]
MSPILEWGLDLLHMNETLRKRPGQTLGGWPKEPGVSWFRFFLIWWAVEAVVRWFGVFAFPADVRESMWVNLSLLFVAAPLAWAMTRQFAGTPLMPTFPAPSYGKARAVAEGLAFGAIAFALIFPLQWVDARLFGSQPLPALENNWGTLALLLAVNGVWYPVFEELAWRGWLQRSLNVTYGIGWSLAITSVLFTLKHALVDMSPGRLLTILGIGLCVGIAHRRGGLYSAITSHIVLNIGASTLAWLSRHPG